MARQHEAHICDMEHFEAWRRELSPASQIGAVGKCECGLSTRCVSAPSQGCPIDQPRGCPEVPLSRYPQRALRRSLGSNKTGVPRQRLPVPPEPKHLPLKPDRPLPPRGSHSARPEVPAHLKHPTNLQEAAVPFAAPIFGLTYKDVPAPLVTDHSHTTQSP